MDKGRLLNLARRFKRVYESGKPYTPDSSWTLTQHQEQHKHRVERAQRLLSLEHIPHLTEAELHELFADTDALGFFRDQGKRDRELDERLSGEGTKRIRSALLSLFQIAEAELTPDVFSKAKEAPGLGPLLISELLSYRFPSRYYTYSSNATLPALRILGEDVKATQPHGKKGDHYLYFAIRPLMEEICDALRKVGLSEVDYMLADIFVQWIREIKPSSDSPRYWKISPGEKAIYWKEFEELNCIAVGWSGAGDLRRFNSQEGIKDFITRDGWEWKLPYTSEQLWWFGHEMQIGDTVFAYGGKRILGVGEIVGGYEFGRDNVMHFAHRRPVDWIYLKSRPIGNLPNELQGKLTKTETIIRLSEHEGEQIMALYEGGEPGRLGLGKYFAARGLHFTPHQLATFYTALKTKGFVILTGISGTGKTKLAQYFAESLGSKDQFHFAAVRPDWRDSKSLLGYFNPLLGEQGQFQPTDFLGFILRAKAEYAQRGKDAHPYFILLDEMNLAKVEYYFADFLSVLESGRDDDDFTKEAIRFQYPEGIDGPPRALRLPPNLYFIGTVNVDETTYMFSPKVLDRAFTLELSTVEFPEYINSTSEGEFELSPDERQSLLDDFTRDGKFATIGGSEKEQIKAFAKQPDGEYKSYAEHLTILSALLQPHDLHFGYRVFDEIMMFLTNAHGSPVFDGFGPDGLDAAFDAAVLMKVLPKFHGTRGKLRLPLLNVCAWAMTPGAGYDLRKQVEGLEKEISGSEEKEKARLDLIEELRENPDEARIGGETFAYPRTALKALRMLHDLYTTGFASFA